MKKCSSYVFKVLMSTSWVLHAGMACFSSHQKYKLQKGYGKSCEMCWKEVMSGFQLDWWWAVVWRSWISPAHKRRSEQKAALRDCVLAPAAVCPHSLSDEHMRSCALQWKKTNADSVIVWCLEFMPIWGILAKQNCLHVNALSLWHL